MQKALQEAFELKPDKNTPLIATISRLADQKGFDLIVASLEEMLSYGTQYAVLGTGERKYHDIFTELAKKFPNTFGIKIAYDNKLAHLIEAGADMFLMPSKYEPCGLNQLYSLKYGTVPIVRGVGGLEDTIVDYTKERGRGTGFKFYTYSASEMLDAVKRALNIYKNKDAWRTLVSRCMNEDFSWQKSAEEYLALYKKAIKKHESR